MDVAAVIANRAGGDLVQPLEVEEGHPRRVHLRLATAEKMMSADLTLQRATVNFDGRRLRAELTTGFPSEQESTPTLCCPV